MNKQRFLNVFVHITGCVLFLALPVLIAPDFPRSVNFLTNKPTQRDLIAYVLMIGFFYLNFFILIEKFYFRRRYFIFFSIVLLSFIIVSSVPDILLPQQDHYQPRSSDEDFPKPPPPQQDKYRPPPPRNNEALPFKMQRMELPSAWHNYFVFSSLHYLFIFLALVFFSLILKTNIRLRWAEKEKLNTELRYLKTQINPHFLFNTLNTIYSLAIEKSAGTANAVIRLSEMMRYIINDTSKDFVRLNDELKYINNYIALQKLRFGKAVHVYMEEQGQPDGKKIAPLILIPFIENAFKYGVNAEKESDIFIEIDVQEDKLKMLVKNRKVTVSAIESSGLGIANTRNRLQLLYPSNHELIIDDGETFSVSLLLQLE